MLCLIHPSSSDFLSHFNTNEHHIIFNEIGQIATSMSYLHIGIPVNLTSIQHHITAFSSYLTRFTSLKTDHPNKLQFQRVITELATFAKRKLDKLSDKLRFIDHVLPEDPTPPARNKRFIDTILLEICKKDDHQVRVALGTCKQNLILFIAQEQSCLFQLKSATNSLIPEHSYLYEPSLRTKRQFSIASLNTCQRTLPKNQHLLDLCNADTKLISNAVLTCISNTSSAINKPPNFADNHYNRTLFADLTSTTTTTTPAPPPYPFFPFPTTRPPYHSTLTSPPPPRHKRQILAAIGLATGVLGTFLGLFNKAEITEIQTQLLNLQDQQHIVTTIVEKHEHELATLHDELIHLTSIVETLIMYNPALVYATLDATVLLITEKLDSLFDTLQQLQHQRLSVSLLDEFQLTSVFNSLKATALHREVKLLPARPQDLFQLDTSYVRSGSEILIIVHVPVVMSDSLLTLFEYVPFPYPLLATSSTPPPAIHTLQDLANSLNVSSSSALYFVPDFPMIAIGRNSDINSASYRLISQSDLAACIQKNHIYLCEKHQTLRNDLPGSCLGALYLQHEQGVIENCKIDRRPLREVTFQLSPVKHIVYSPYPFTTQILCNNGSHYTQKLFGTTYLTVPPLCHIKLINRTISSDGNIRVSVNPLIFTWHFDPPLLPTELLTSASHLDDQFNELKSNLSQFRHFTNESITDKQFSDLLYNHVTSYSNSSAVIWLSLSFTFLAILITTVCACMICRARRRRLLRRRRQHYEAGIPLSVTAFADSDEDEISYLARTAPTRGIPSQK